MPRPRRRRRRPPPSLGSRLARLWPAAATRRRWWRAFRGTPPAMQLLVAFTATAALWFLSNGVYQVIRKPSELFFPVSGVWYRTPQQTWERYAPIFRQHSTAIISPALLAAIAQLEGSGNPVVRTYWRWSWSAHPFEVYRPASSAVGMYQITNGTFAQARRYCIHDHVVVEDGPWHDWRSCWFNSLYSRLIPSNAVELTAAYLDRSIASILARRRISSATVRQKQALAAVIHLCGAGAGDVFARRHFRLLPGERCGDHAARAYLARIDTLRASFEAFARRD